jgi:hypothetical protein
MLGATLGDHPTPIPGARNCVGDEHRPGSCGRRVPHPRDGSVGSGNGRRRTRDGGNSFRVPAPSRLPPSTPSLAF